ncbi:MAG TPA: hypothetical protein VH561_10190 [Micromonosporaceae bacterium]|jgi:hypothetical protein
MVRRRVPVRPELALAVVVAVLAIAVGWALRSTHATAPAPAPSAAQGLPRDGDLTMAGRAGDTLVGLTVRPGRPGVNQVYVYLAPDPAPGSPVQVTVAGQAQQMTSCGDSCRVATVALTSGGSLAVDVAGAGAASFQLPSLPAPPAGALVDQATGVMRALGSYHVDEDFSGTRASYDFVVPDRLRMRVWYGNGEQDTVWIGSTVYKRDFDGTWSTSTGTQPAVPYFGWTAFQPLVATTVAGAGEVDHTPVTVVHGFGGHGDDPEPVWFTLWIDQSSGRVLRSQMWAPGHFMDDRYNGFDQPAEIQAPDVPR